MLKKLGNTYIKNSFLGIIGLFCLLMAPSVYSQDPVFSQFYNTALQINPALTGNTFNPRISLNYRNQWPNWPLAYTTYAIAYDQYFDKANSGVGLYILTDNAGNGIITSNKIGSTYAYSLELLDNKFLKLGIETVFYNQRLSWDKLVFFNQIDPKTGNVTPGGTVLGTPEERPDNLSVNKIDFSAGLTYFTKSFHIGVAAKHLNTPKWQFVESGKTESIYGLPIRYTLHLGGQVEIKSLKQRQYKSYWSPQLLYLAQGPFKQINLGSNINIGVVHAGIWYRNVIRNSDAIIFALGAQAGKFKATYSFDLTLSGVGLDQGGAHEIGLVFVIRKDKKKQKYNDCFEIFR